MKLEKQKAEAYVRSQIKELMELSFGCELKAKGISIGEGTGKFVMYQPLVSSSKSDPSYQTRKGCSIYLYDVDVCPQHFTLENFNDYYEIIGHPIQLHHWLRVLDTVGLFLISTKGRLHRKITGGFEDVCDFNLTTGQPAYEADYQAFNEIVGI